MLLTLDNGDFTVLCTHMMRTQVNVLIFTDLSGISQQTDTYTCLNAAFSTKTLTVISVHSLADIKLQ